MSASIRTSFVARTAGSALLLAAAVVRLGAQVSPAPRASAGPDSAIVARERAIFDALMHKDAAAMNRAFGTDPIVVDGGGVLAWDRTKTATYIAECTTTRADFAHAATRRSGADVVILTYDLTEAQSCGGHRTPSPVHVLSIWHMRDGRWVNIAHSETPATP